VLASGDPLFQGIGVTLARVLGPERLHVVPHPSSVSLACARLGWPADGVEVISAVARPLARVRRVLAPGARLLVLSEDDATPGMLAALLTDAGYGGSVMTVLAQLGGPAEHRVDGPARGWAHPPGDRLNVVAVSCVADAEAPVRGEVPGLSDDAYDHDGQLTKREVRAVTLAHLAPRPGELLWDVGAGNGSIGIEWLRAHRTCRAVAVESDEARIGRIGANAEALGVPSLQVVRGRAPEALAGLPAPDVVFIGGGITNPGVLDACWAALRPGGRLVANAVTLEAEAVLVAARDRYGGGLTRIEVSRAAPLGGFTGWRPAMPVTIWSTTKDTT
jgi:precorrin-6Y C5,15-methyltransferase (decarboxylating)